MERLIKRFLRVAVFSGIGAKVASVQPNEWWKIIITSLLAGIMAVIDKYLRHIGMEKK